MKGFPPAEQAVELANRLNNKTWLSYAEYGLGQAYFLAGRYREAKEWLGRAGARLAAAPENVPPGTTGSGVLRSLSYDEGDRSCMVGRVREVRALCCEQASELAEQNDRPYDLIAANYGRGVVQMMRGNINEAESALDEAPSYRARAKSGCFCRS